MNVLFSPWRKQFERFLAGAHNQLRVVAPYYGKHAIHTLLHQTKEDVEKSFIFALSDGDVQFGSQSIEAIDYIRSDPLAEVRFIKKLHAKLLISDNTKAIVTSSNITRGGLDINFEMGIHIDEWHVVDSLINKFDELWSQADAIDSHILDRLRILQRTTKPKKQGHAYGASVRLRACFENAFI